MRRKRPILISSFFRRNIQFYIILTWCAGLFAGLHIVPAFFSAHDAEIYGNASMRQSFPLLLFLAFLPHGLTFACVHFQKVMLLPFLCLLKALSFGFSLFLLGKHFLSGSWLAVILFLFTDLVNICLLLWSWLRQGRTVTKYCKKDIFMLCSVLLAACIFDSFAITPFLQKII